MVLESLDLAAWLRELCGSYVFDVGGTFNRPGGGSWPLTATDVADLEKQLAERGHLLPLPSEPAALANVLEVLVVDFILDATQGVKGLEARRGTDRGYPDIEMFGPALAGAYWAVDVKVARRAATRAGPARATQSRITLYTGNTYFRHPDLRWPGTFRPFAQYAGHLDVILLYTFNPSTRGRAEDLEFIVQEPWRIGSRQRSSTTREYIGAVMEISRLREGKGDFATSEDFYRHWRSFPFRLSKGMEKQLARLLKERDAELAALRIQK
jgi:hypothetical protein